MNQTFDHPHHFYINLSHLPKINRHTIYKLSNPPIIYGPFQAASIHTFYFPWGGWVGGVSNNQN